jgi:hypothetical protein
MADDRSMKRVATLILIGAAAAGCSSPTAAPSPGPLEPEGTIVARELPDRLLENYELNYGIQQETPEEYIGYRYGDLRTPLYVFTTPEGPVFVDHAGGGMAWAESCAAMDVFVTRNSWKDGYGCLDGTLHS